MKRNALSAVTASLLIVSILSCNDDSTVVPVPTVMKSWTVHMNIANEITAPAGRTDSAVAQLDLFTNNTLHFEITLLNFATGDALTAGHIHSGDAVTNGPVYIPFTADFTANPITGNVELTAAQADSIQNYPMYVNIHST